MTARSFVLGRRVDGRPLTTSWPLGHTLVSGTTGSGKSTTLNSLIAQWAGWADIALLGVDLKHTELAVWEPRFSLVAQDHADADRLIAVVRQVVEHRQLLLTRLGVREWHTSLGPWIVVVIDEAAEFFGLDIRKINQLIGTTTSLDDALDDADLTKTIKAELATARLARDIRAANLESLARMARSAGVRLIVATQYPTTSVIGSQVRAQLDWSLMHRVTRDEHVDVGLGDGWSKTIPASSITGNQPGAYWLGCPLLTRPARAQGHHLADSALAERAAETAYLRHPLTVLTPTCEAA